MSLWVFHVHMGVRCFDQWQKAQPGICSAPVPWTACSLDTLHAYNSAYGWAWDVNTGMQNDMFVLAEVFKY